MSLAGILLLLLAGGAQANAEKADVNRFSSVLENCKGLTHSEWIKRYHEVEVKVIEALEKEPKLSQSADQELLEVVFPQDLPKTHPMRRAFIGCFEIFHEYQMAVNNVQSMSALKRLESCYQDAYKRDPPKVLAGYFDCLKRIRY